MYILKEKNHVSLFDCAHFKSHDIATKFRIVIAMDYVGGICSLGIEHFNALLNKLRHGTGGFIVS